jgi:hypothetical protein
MKGNKYDKYNNELCNNEMTFQECELAILRGAVDETEEKKGRKIANSEDITKMLVVVEEFIRKKKLICYGGTAINDILPKFAQFYNRDIEIPDYDFYSPDAMNDAKKLADIFYKKGYLEVEAKSGVHVGTYKLFVNFIPIADITMIHKGLFQQLNKEAIVVNGVHYSPVNFLRMNMFLELSRPAGDVSRWEKVLKRLTLLNKYYPLKLDKNCDVVDFQRDVETSDINPQNLYSIVRDAFVDQNVIFFGGYATSLYSRYMPHPQKHMARMIPDFDVLSEDPDKTALVIRERIAYSEFKKLSFSVIKHDAIDELIPEHLEIRIGKDTIAFIYKPIACHSYNTITIGNDKVNIASIDTMLSFYLAFTYVNKPYYNRQRLLCMAKFLFDVEEKNRLEQNGLLKRFSIDCYGKQMSLEEMRAEKAKKYKELMGNRNGAEFQKWFLKYIPANKNIIRALKSINSKDVTPQLEKDIDLMIATSHKKTTREVKTKTIREPIQKTVKNRHNFTKKRRANDFLV